MTDLKVGNTVWWFQSGLEFDFSGRADAIHLENFGLKSGVVLSKTEAYGVMYYSLPGLHEDLRASQVHPTRNAAIDAMMRRLLDIAANFKVGDEVWHIEVEGSDLMDITIRSFTIDKIDSELGEYMSAEGVGYCMQSDNLFPSKEAAIEAMINRVEDLRNE